MSKGRVIFIVFIAICFIGAYLDVHIGESIISAYAFEGKVVEKKRNNAPKPTGCLWIEGYKDSFPISNYKLYSFVKPGDIIIKKRGNKKYQLIRNSDTLIFGPF